MDLLPKEYKQRPGGIIEPAGAKPSAAAAWSRLKSGAKSVNFKSLGLNFLRAGIIGGLLLLGLLLLSWGGLKFYQRSLESQTAKARQEYAKVFGNTEQELAKKVVDLESRMTLVQSALKNHVYSSEFFNRLSAVTLPQVQWVSCNLTLKNSQAALKGRTASYSILAKQILSLQSKDSGFSNVLASGISLDKAGGVGFDVSLSLDPKILQKN